MCMGSLSMADMILSSLYPETVGEPGKKYSLPHFQVLMHDRNFYLQMYAIRCSTHARDCVEVEATSHLIKL